MQRRRVQRGQSADSAAVSGRRQAATLAACSSAFFPSIHCCDVGRPSTKALPGVRPFIPRLGDRLAALAGELFADVLDNLPAPRLAFQGFRHHLAELEQPGADALAAGARPGFNDPLHRQIVRQRRQQYW